MKATEVFEWKFTPPNYFEEEFTIRIDGQAMKVAEGIARAEIDAELFDTNPSIRRQFHEALHDHLLGVQLVARESFDLKDSTRIRINSDGSKAYFIEPESAVFKVRGGTPDLQLVDAQGNVVMDTKRDRIEKKRRFAESVARFQSGDDTLARMIRGFDGAMRNPKNEFVYLYEIADAAKSKFGKKKCAADFGFDPDEWDEFGRLCNELPVWQGRHRGKDFGPMRDATDDELERARRIAIAIIEAYLAHLETEKAAGGQ